MSIFTIPVQKVPDQEFLIDIDGQKCQIHLYQRYMYVYMDLTVDDNILFQGKMCLNRVDLVDSVYFGFRGRLKFIDTQGNDDPYYTGFNERWFLVYVQ